jgi:hypothetical protein
MSRWVFLLGVGVMLVALAFVVTYRALGPKPGVTEANVRRLKPGMTVREVETILGAKARVLARAGDCCKNALAPDPSPSPWVALSWGEDGMALVYFDERDHLERAEFRRTRATRQSPLDSLRSRLGW